MFMNIFQPLSLLWKMTEVVQLAESRSLPSFKQQSVAAKERTSSWDSCGSIHPEITVFSPFNI